MQIQQDSRNAHRLASRALKEGGVICFATETVYALACDASNDLAVQKLYDIKKRDLNKPISVMVNNLEAAKEFLELSKSEEKIAKKFMPGPITLVLGVKNCNTNKLRVSKFLNGNKNNLGLRIPNHKFSLALLKDFGGIMAATSANFSQKEPAVKFSEAFDCFGGSVDLIIDGGVCHGKISSTVLKIKSFNNEINIIRKGIIDIESLNEAL